MSGKAYWIFVVILLHLPIAETAAPLLQSWLDPGPMFCYIFTAFHIGYFLFYHVLRILMQLKKSHKIPETTLLSSTEDVQDIDGIIRGYHDWIPGQIAFLCVGLFSVFLFACWLVIMFDAYWRCSFTGVDDECWSGTYPITGYSKPPGIAAFIQYKLFFLYWWVFAVWFAILLYFKPDFRNWCRIQTDIHQADHICIQTRIGENVMTLHPNGLVRLSRRIRKFIFNPYIQETIPVHVISGTEGENFKYIVYRFQRYVIINDTIKKSELFVGRTLAQLSNAGKKGLTLSEYNYRFKTVGPNVIPYRVESALKLLAAEYLTGFYFYQVIVYMVWFWWSYLIAASAEFSIVLLSSFTSMYIKRKNQLTMQKMAIHSSVETVFRGNVWIQSSCDDLVPGDVIRVSSNWVVPCDVILTAGSAVCNEAGLTGESMPVPKIAASPESKEEYNMHKHSRHTLFAGTTVLSAGNNENDQVLGLVLRTGIRTSKGDLVSQILNPTQIIFKYDEEFVILFLCLFILGIIGAMLVLIFLHANGSNMHYVAKFCTVVFTVCQVLSPLLPLALVAGQLTSVRRLSSEMEIFCVNPKRIAICGKIRVCCFDKTGTLTQEGLEFLGVQTVWRDSDQTELKIRSSIHSSRTSNLEMIEGRSLRDITLLDNMNSKVNQIDNQIFKEYEKEDEKWFHPIENDMQTMAPEMLFGLVTCQAITKSGVRFVGNQVEVQMFKATGWELIEEHEKPTIVRCKEKDQLQELLVIKRFQFDHARMTMSVLIQDQSGRLHVYCKGAAEKIEKLCLTESLPPKFIQEAEKHASNGYYVLALAKKSLGNMSLEDAAQLSRNDFEIDMRVVGFILFRNELKPDTSKALALLQKGNVRNVMITGDNMQTGCYIAEQSGMIGSEKYIFQTTIDKNAVIWKQKKNRSSWKMKSPAEKKAYSTQDMKDLLNQKDGMIELAITGKAWELLLLQNQIYDLLLHIRIFARFSPTQKQDVVRSLMQRGLICGMCGDGGNDCGALRIAHAGLALSDAEVSMVSPFVSKTKSIMSMFNLLREGRCAMATSFASFRFIIMYSQSYLTVKLTIAFYNVTPSPIVFVVWDVFMILGISYAIVQSRALPKLSQDRPTSSILGPHTTLSIFGNTIINIIFLSSALYMMSKHPKYIQWPLHCANANFWWQNADNWESSMVAVVFIFQLNAAGLAVSYGGNFRKAWFKNKYVVALFLIFEVLSIALLVCEPNEVSDAFHFASRNWNSATTTSIPWRTYQGQNGTRCDHPGGLPGCPCGAPASDISMPFSFRLQILFLLLGNQACLLIYSNLFAGPIRGWIKKKYKKERIHLKL